MINNFLTIEERFRLMATVSPAIIWMTDVDGNCSFVNQTWLDFTGLSEEQALNQNEWIKLIHPDDKNIFSAYYSDLNTDSVITVEYRLRHADGSWRWVLDRAVPVFQENHIFCGYMGSAVDITERKRADIANQYSAAIVQSSDDAIMSKDTNSIVTGWNPASERIFGYTAAEMIGSSILKLFPPDRVEEEKFLMDKVFHGESIKHFEAVRVRKDGALIDVSVSVSPIRDSTGKVIGASKIARDITDAKKHEKELKRSEATVRAIVETAATSIITIDSKGIIISVNPAVERLFHYKPEEIIGLNIKILMPEPYHSEHDNYILHYMAGGKPQIIGESGRDVIGLRKGGSIFPISLAISEIKVEGERQFVGILTDMTNQKMNEERLLNYSLHLEELVAIQTAEVRAIVQTAINGIVTISAEGLIDEFNPAAELIFGYRKDEVIGKNVKILMPEPYHSEHDDYLDNFITTGIKKIIGIGREVTGQRKNGNQFPMYLAVGHTVLSGDKHIFVGFLSDITEQKLNEKRLAEARDAAEAGARIKAAFIANMSHEIRTPMNAILGFSEVVLQDPNLNSNSLKNVRIIFSAAKSLLGIINDVLDVSKMESGKFTLESVCFNLYNVLNDSIHTIESNAAEKDLILNFDYDSTLPIRFMGDPTRLRQVILNLVSNSIKFTKEGSVKLIVKVGEKANMLHFSIVDTGIGMTEDQVTTVFEAFSQADASTTRRFGGTGLGTSISKQIVELMDGKIWVESVFGEGTTFHFTAHLPVAINTEGCLFEDSSIVEKGYVSPRLFNILLAEDIEANATLVTLRLEQQGHSIHWAKNGREAVDMFNAGNCDLILMDVQMPKLDGLGATREIRILEENSGKKRISILALTASVLHEERQECIDAGMDGVVGKPIEFSELLSTMEKIIPEGVGRIQTIQHREINSISTVDFSPLDGVIDYEKGLKTWLDTMAYGKALKSFAEKYCDDMDKIITIALDDKNQIRQIAHLIKGVSGNLAIIDVPMIAGEIESAVLSGQKENLDILLLKLKDALVQVSAAIDKLQLPITTQASATKPFDKESICQLFRELYIALDKLNPDAVEPVISSLNAYLDEKELAKIVREIDNFDFEEATNQTNALVKKLELMLG